MVRLSLPGAYGLFTIPGAFYLQPPFVVRSTSMTVTYRTEILKCLLVHRSHLFVCRPRIVLFPVQCFNLYGLIPRSLLRGSSLISKQIIQVFLRVSKWSSSILTQGDRIFVRHLAAWSLYSPGNLLYRCSLDSILSESTGFNALMGRCGFLLIKERGDQSGKDVTRFTR